MSQLLKDCLNISDEYLGMGLKLTLRQMYYQLVSRAIIPNGQKHYDRVGRLLTKARYDGAFPLNRIEDRGRDTGEGDYTKNRCDVTEALEDARLTIKTFPSWLIERDKWFMQPTIVSVWVEKEALSGVFADPCEDLGVSMFACKGYPSVSALNDWLNKMLSVREAYYERDRPEPIFKVLYFGDHDPDGMEIPESAERNIRKLEYVKETCPLDLEFERVALNRNQIREYDPPPFPAKITSARFKKYVDEYDTHDAWELDALEPGVLRDLIRDAVTSNFDQGVFADQQSELEGIRERFIEELKRPGFNAGALER